MVGSKKDQTPKFQTIKASGYTPDKNYASPLDIARHQWQLAVEGCIKFSEKAKKGAKCSGTFKEPYFCVEKGVFDMGNMSAGIGSSGGNYPTFKTKSENVEAGYGFAAMLIGRALGIRSQMEVRPDFDKNIVLNDEALIQSMASLTDSYGAYPVLKEKWSAKDMESLVEAVFKRHCKKTIYKFDYPFDFRSIGNAFNPFGDLAYQFSFHEPAAAYVARDRGNQWMVGYSQLTRPSLMISHYDKYRVMKEYQCGKVFGCKKIPRCRNFGYVNQFCQCQCAPGFKGGLCETWLGNDTYPRAQKALCSFTVSEPTIISLHDASFYTENEYRLSSFALGSSMGFYSQWCTVQIQAFGDKRPVIEPINVFFQEGKPLNQLVSASTFPLDWFDCGGMMTGQVIYSNATKRRVLCFSSFYTYDSPQIRVNRSDTSIDFTWLWTIYALKATPFVFKIKLGITYEPMPTKILRVYISRKWAFEHLGIDEAAMRAVGGVAAGAIAGSVVAILLIGGVLGGLYYVHKKKQEAQEYEEVEVKED